MVRAVLFDLDDTLFDHAHCADAALAGVRGLHGCFERLEMARLAQAHSTILEELHLEVLSGRLDLDAARVERFRRLFEAAGERVEPEIAAAAATAYRRGYVSARRAIAGARDLLAAVRQYAQVVVVSNNLLQEQQEKLRHCELDPYVDVLVVSEEAGVSKPEPRIFEIALARARCAATDAVMVGDSWTNDIEGARAAGIRPVWFNRSGQQAPDPQVDVITALQPTADVLGTIFGASVRAPVSVRPERA